MTTIGIDTMSFYVPENRVLICDIIEHRKKESQKLFEILSRGQITTQQVAIRITRLWQDAVTLATQSTMSMLKDNTINLDMLRYLVSATETPVDTSKPNASYMLGILKQAGINIPQNIVTYQTQHACAGGSISLLQVSSLISTAAVQNSSAIITMSDISHYEVPSNAEVTQGAGAVSILVSKNPRLLEIDIAHVGHSSECVDDFFRAINVSAASVKGRFSMQCYINACYESFKDYAKQRGASVDQIIDESDYLVFHAPFKSMATIALTHILKKHLSKSPEQIAKILHDKHLETASDIIKDLGNTYTAATYFSLGYLLSEQYKALGNDISGKKILIISYGAGNTSLVFQATLAPSAGDIIRSWNLSQQMEEYTKIDFETYKYWCSHAEPEGNSCVITSNRAEKQVYLSHIRDDNYRIYGIK